MAAVKKKSLKGDWERGELLVLCPGPSPRLEIRAEKVAKIFPKMLESFVKHDEVSLFRLNNAFRLPGNKHGCHSVEVTSVLGVFWQPWVSSLAPSF